MRTIFAAVGVLLLAWLGWPHGTAASPPTDDSQVEAAIRATRAHYQEINAHASRYRQVKKELSGFSAEGGTLVASFDGDTLVKIAATFYGESGQAAEEYYYWDNQLVFIFRADSDYDRLLSGKIIRTVEDRFYFDRGVLIRWVGPHAKLVAPGSGPFQEKQTGLLQSAAELARGARSLEPTIEAAR